MKKFLILLLNIFNINNVTSYSFNRLPFTLVNPIQPINKNNGNNEIAILKTIESNKLTNNSIIFLPGIISDTLPIDKLYSDFLNIISEKNINVHIPNENNIEALLDYNNDVTNITLVAHSNAALNAIEISNYSNSINNLVLLDPINLPINNEKPKYDYNIEDINSIDKNMKKLKQKYEINNINNLLIINTKRSNDWRILPVTFPIGQFSIKMTDLDIDENVEKNIIKVDSFGHFDILDNSWSTAIHNTLSRGSDDRDDDKIKLYHNWIANKIINIH